MRTMYSAAALAALVVIGCGNGHGGGGDTAEATVRAYAASDACHGHTDVASCGAAPGCTWSVLASCAEGTGWLALVSSRAAAFAAPG